jgi:histidyl-tRNA synthetase
VAIPPIPAPEVFIARAGDKVKNEAVKLASSLREAGIGVLQASSSKSLKAQLRQANNFGARYVIIIGEEEIKTGTVIFRNMTTAEQETVALAGLQHKLQCQL